MARNGRRGPILTAKAPVHWATAIFSMVPEGSVRRRPSDIVRVATALLGLLVLSVTTGLVPELSKWLYEELQRLPEGIDWVLTLFYPIAIAAAVAAVLIAAAVSRRLHLGIALLAAGVVGTLGALGLDATAGERSVDALQSAGADVTDADVTFPPIAFAVCVAVLLVATPFLTRPTRQLVRTVIVVAAVCAIADSDALPAAIVAGLALGWGTAAAVHLALGTPRATPSIGNVAAALRDFGLEVTNDQVALASDQVWGESRYVATSSDGERMRISAVGRDATDARLFAKLWRVVWYKDSGPPLTLTRAQQVEHGAFLLFLADRAGVDLPDVVAVGLARDGLLAVLVTREATGTRFDELDGRQVTDPLLDAAWEQVRRLGAARIAHGAIVASNIVMVGDEHVALRDGSRMSSSAPPERVALDGVGLLLATAAIVGVPRAVAAAQRTLGDQQLSALAPYLQPSVLSRQEKKSVDDAKALLSELRDATAAATDIEAVEPTELRRVAPATIAMAAGALLGVYLLLGQLADIPDPAEIFKDPEWGWIVVAALLSQTPQLTGAVAIRGSVAVHLPLGPVTALQFANNFTGLVGGTVANTALVVRFFQKQGQAFSVAMSSGVLNSTASMIVQAILMTIGLVIDGSSLQRPSSSDDGGNSGAEIVIVVILAAAVVSGIVLLIPRARAALSARVRPQLTLARANLREIARDPRKPAQLFGGNLCSQVLFAMTLGASLHAYGGSLPLLELIVVNSLASLVGGMAPVPGGMGVVEAGMIGGLTAFGVPDDQAIAATFTHRLFTAYLPPIWGWFSLQWLRRHDYV